MKLNNLFSAFAAAAVFCTSAGVMLPTNAVSNAAADEECVIYAEPVTVEPGQKHVPMNICIRNNPGYITCGVRIYYGEELIPLAEENKPTKPVCSVGEAADSLISQVSLNPNSRIIGFGTMGSDANETDDGVMFTFYFDVADDIEPGTYTLATEIDQMLGIEAFGSGTVEQPCTIAADTFYLNVQSSAVSTMPPETTMPFETTFATEITDTDEESVIYAEPVTVTPGQKNVPLNICIRNNPGYVTCGIRIFCGEGLIPLTQENKPTKPQYSVGAAADSLLSTVSLNPETRVLGFAAMGADANDTDDGTIVTFYFDVADDIEPGTYTLATEIDQLMGIDEFGAPTVEQPCFCAADTFYLNVQSAAVSTVSTETTTVTDTTDETETTTTTAERASATPKAAFIGGDVTAKQGDRQVAYTVKLADNPGVAVISLRIQYPEGLEPVLENDKLKAELGPDFASATATVSYNPEKHLIGLVTLSTELLNKGGDLFTCYFNVPADMPANTYPVTIEVLKLTDVETNPVQSTSMDGSFTVQEGVAGGGMPGDVSCDSQVDVADAVLLARFLAEDSEVTLTAQGRQNADVNGSEQPDADDIVRILKYIARLITHF